ncbi:MAG: hypothetical protein Q8P53_00775 [Candidatus Shapirobacteria bacterium]|nr:hypothetical protein [Candidatus Shapirobacteria bacterium]
MIKAIIFDFGNVVCTFNNELILEKFSKYSGQSIESLREIIYKNSDLPKRYEMGQISSTEFYEGILKITGLNISKDKFIEAYTNKFMPILSTFNLIKELKNNYKVALLSKY